MALGGIPVSGGISGNGTLIFCNLLYSPLLYDSYGIPLARPSYVLGGDAGVAGYAAAFVIDRDPKTLFKTASGFLTISVFADYGATIAGTVLATSVGHGLTGTKTGRILGTTNYNGFYTITIVDVDTFYFTATWVATETGQWSPDICFTMIHGAAPPMVYGVVLIGHNITAAGVSLAKFEGGMDANYNTVSEDLVINVATLTPVYHLLATPVAYDHWRVRVNFIASTALQIGEIFLIGASPLPFSRNFNWGATPHKEIGQIVNEGVGGVPRVYARWERLREGIAFTQISEAQLTALQLAARNGHVIFSPAGTDGRAYFGTLSLEAPREIQGGYDVNAVFTEAAQ